MFTIISLEHPIRSSIILYLIILALIMIFRPNLITGKNKKHKYILPIVIIAVSMISYYIFALLNSLV